MGGETGNEREARGGPFSAAACSQKKRRSAARVRGSLEPPFPVFYLFIHFFNMSFVLSINSVGWRGELRRGRRSVQVTEGGGVWRQVGGGGRGVIMSSGLNCQNIRWNLPVLSSRASAIAVLREHALSRQLAFTATSCSCPLGRRQVRHRNKTSRRTQL